MECGRWGPGSEEAAEALTLPKCSSPFWNPEQDSQVQGAGLCQLLPEKGREARGVRGSVGESLAGGG